MRKMPAGSTLRTLAGAGVACGLAFGVGVAHGAGSGHGCGKNGFCGVRAQASGPRKRNLCVRYRCTTVTADARAEVLFVTERLHGGRFAPIVGTYARWRPTGRITLLGRLEAIVYGYGPRGFGPGISVPIALAGRYVAFAPRNVFCSSNDPSCGGPEKVVRVDMKTGRRVGTGETYTVTDLVLTPQGTVAWIERTDEPHEVRTARTPADFSSPTLLASSPTIDPHSLALASGHLYWTEGAQPREVEIN